MSNERERKPTPMEAAGLSEPGFARFRSERERLGHPTPDTILQYAGLLGKVRQLAGKGLLDLSVDEVETLDGRLRDVSVVHRIVLKMFFTTNKKMELALALPRQSREKDRRLGLKDILMPEEVDQLIAAADSARDRALIAVLASTGMRINEALAVEPKELVVVDGGSYQIWLPETKVRGEERYTPEISGPYQRYLDEWLHSREFLRSPRKWLFPSSWDLNKPMNDGTAGELVKSLARKSGLTKRVYPHLFRHSRVSWGIIRREDTATLSLGIWGLASSPMLNRYNAFKNLRVSLGSPSDVVLPPVRGLPTPPAVATADRVMELEAKIATLEQGVKLLVSQIASDRGIPPGTKLTVELDDVDSGRPGT